MVMKLSQSFLEFIAWLRTTLRTRRTGFPLILTMLLSPGQRYMPGVEV